MPSFYSRPDMGSNQRTGTNEPMVSRSRTARAGMDRSSDVTTRDELRIETPAWRCAGPSPPSNTLQVSPGGAPLRTKVGLSLTACVACPPPQAQAPTPGVVGLPSRGRRVGRERARVLPLHCALAGAVHCSSACGFLASGLGPKFGTSSINREHMPGLTITFFHVANLLPRSPSLVQALRAGLAASGRLRRADGLARLAGRRGSGPIQSASHRRAHGCALRST